MYINIVGDRQSGRTTALAHIAAADAISDPNQYVLFFTTVGLIPHTMKIIEKTLDAGKIKFKAQRDKVLLSNGSEIFVIPFKSAAGRGRRADCVIIDNVDMTDHKYQLELKMIIPTLTNRIITSSLKPHNF